jgi:hypothetical protein
MAVVFLIQVDVDTAKLRIFKFFISKEIQEKKSFQLEGGNADTSRSAGEEAQ